MVVKEIYLSNNDFHLHVFQTFSFHFHIHNFLFLFILFDFSFGIVLLIFCNKNRFIWIFWFRFGQKRKWNTSGMTSAVAVAAWQWHVADGGVLDGADGNDKCDDLKILQKWLKSWRVVWKAGYMQIQRIDVVLMTTLVVFSEFLTTEWWLQFELCTHNDTILCLLA